VEWAYLKGVPVVYEEHQTPDAQFDWWKDFHRSINKAARVVAVSETSAEALREVCGVTQPIVVRNPLLADPMASGWHRDNGPRQNEETLSVSTVARLVLPKGLKYLLEAVVQVRALHPHVQFKVHGDGPLRQELLAYADELGLNGEQIFVGAFNHQDLDSIMSETDMFVMSSILEGQPLAVVEAMAYGCPIVTTSVGGVPELIQDEVNGLLCEPGDPGCLAQKICTLIQEPDLRQRLGQAARKSYEQGPYQPAAVAKHFILVYRDVLRQESTEVAA
jgi:glycosyltransferase involved in cell wall biosynthesis